MKNLKLAKFILAIILTPAFVTAGNPYPKFQADLQFFDSEANVFYNTSGANSYYNSTFSCSVIPGEDNISPVGSRLAQLRILKDGFQLSTNRQPVITADDTIFLYLSQASQLTHRLVLSTKYFAPSSNAILIDQYLNTQTPFTVSNTDTAFYSFDITADPQSNRSDRFFVVFKPIATILKVNINSIKAFEQSTGITIQWQTQNELNIRSYDIERSIDGIHFDKVNSILPSNSNTATIYNWIDKTLINGNLYYRVKVVEQSGKFDYTQVINIKRNSKESSITILANPIINNTINLQFNNQQPGVYEVKLYSPSGQLVDKKTIRSIGNNWGESFRLTTGLSKGIYNLEVGMPSNKKMIQQILIQ